MIDRHALLCDLAEYYHVYDLNDLPLETVAIYACGLPPKSRIIRKMSGIDYEMDTLIEASILDYIALLTWFKTKDGQKNRNRPKSVVKILTGKKEEKKERTFRTAEGFEAVRNRLIKEAKKNELRTGESIHTGDPVDKRDQREPGKGTRRRRKKRRRESGQRIQQ